METKPRPPHPLNAPGDFYVEFGSCIACGVPEQVAPALVQFSDNPEDAFHQSHCFFARQPQTREETEQAIQALVQSCCAAVRYAGSDPVILERLRHMGHGWCCDKSEGEPAAWHLDRLWRWLAGLWGRRS